jgi:DNA-binding transcriptional LysR family regulator
MELNQMRTFQKLVEYRNFSKAASELHLTQPAVTLQIKNLEEEMHELLFERLGRTLALTPAGEIFYGYVQQILNLTEQARETLLQFSTTRGRLTIGAGTTTIIFRLPVILQQFHHDYPGVEIRIRSGDSEILTRLVMDNAVDLGLVTTKPDPAALGMLTMRPVFEDRIRLVAPPSYPERLSSTQLEDESLILFRSGAGFRRFLEEQFRLHGFKPQVSLELESMEAISRLVQSGLGLAFLPEVAVREELESGQLRRVEVDDWRPMLRQTFLIHRRDKYLSWPIRSFLERIGPA